MNEIDYGARPTVHRLASDAEYQIPIAKPCVEVIRRAASRLYIQLDQPSFFAPFSLSSTSILSRTSKDQIRHSFLFLYFFVLHFHSNHSLSFRALTAVQFTQNPLFNNYIWS